MNGLLQTAKLLAEIDPKRPSEANLRRAVSTAYYSVFDALARACADTLIGRARHPRPAWIAVHRTLDHARARDALRRIAGSASSEEAEVFAAGFLRLQAERHRADYDPGLTIYRDDARALIVEAERTLRALDSLGAEERTMLVVQVLFRARP